MTALHSCGRRW